MPYKVYKDFTFCPIRNQENLLHSLAITLPFFSELTTSKKKNLLESFEEVNYIGGEGRFKPSNVLEVEGQES